MRSSDSCTPVGDSAAAVNECPAPIAFTRRAGLGGPPHDRRDLVGRPWRRPLGGHPALVAGPVGDGRGHERIVRRGPARAARCPTTSASHHRRRSRFGYDRGWSVARRASWPERRTLGDRIVHGTCHHDCPDSCGWTVTVDGRRSPSSSAAAPTTRTAPASCARRSTASSIACYSPDRDPAPAAPGRAEGRGRVRADLVGRRARPRSPTACTPSIDAPRRRGDPAVQRRRQPEPAVDDGPRRPLLPPPRREPASRGRSAGRPSATACA